MPIHAASAENSVGSARRARRLLRQSAALLVDWDGCIAFGDRLAPGATKFLQEHVDHIAIVSNNTTHLPADFVALLANEGVTLPPQRVILAGPAAVERAARDKPSGRALVLANERLRHLARSVGLETDAAEPEAVVLLRDTEFTYQKLQRAANAMQNGARLYVANPDLTHPDTNGARVPETGALLAALAATVDLSEVPVETIGKPGPTLFRQACAALGVEPSQALMIGDNRATDIAGAKALGMPALRVGNGSTLSLATLLDSY